MFHTLNMIHFLLLFFLLGETLIIMCSAFTIEELNSIMYEVDVSKIPLKKSDKQYLPLMHMTSITGKEYQCWLPLTKEEEILEKDSTSGKDIDIQKLLRPMYEGSCLYKIKDWWTYELCFGKTIKQFHIEDGEITGEILTLGLYEFDYKWSNDFRKELFHSTRKPYHSQYYVNGTNCDLTGLPRSAEVRIFCEEDSLDYINWITEPETCNYIIIVRTSLVCSHPLFKSSKETHTIPCHPLLIDEGFSE